MSTVDTRLRRARGSAARRARIQAVLLALPWLIVVVALAWRVHASPWSLLLLIAASAVSGWYVWQVGRDFDDRWLARMLDAQRHDMDDSADLLFPHRAANTPL